MRPSFFSLFKRGKYFRPGAPLLATKGKRIQGDTREAERFAAAGIAFVWEHDLDFRKHFWRKICQITGDPPLSTKATISIEPHRWADLLITNPTNRGRYVYVIECKISAGLAPIQNPTTKAFASPIGYGRLFETNEGAKDSSLRFVVFGFPGKLDLTKVDSRLRLRVHCRKWNHLVIDWPESPLSKDLAFSLGKLNIGAFPASEIRDMKVDTQREDIGQAIAILSEVQRRLDWPQGRGSLRSFQMDEGIWSVGVELNTRKDSNARALEASLQPPQRYLAWFGYQGGARGSSELAVWLYCGSEKIQRRVGLRLNRKKFSAEKLAREGRYFNVVVKATTHAKDNDCEWFCDVFKVLGVKQRSSL
jgi:hypothetical protein